MFRIPDGIDPKVRKVLHAIEGELYKLAKRGDRTGGEGVVYQVITKGSPSTTPVATPGTGTASTSSGDVTIHGDLYVDGTIHGSVTSASLNIDPTFADVSGSRVLGTVYQNSESTMKMVVISVELSG